MEHIAPRTRMHPMLAVAAFSLTLVSLVGAASILGWLPTSKANTPAPIAASVAPDAALATSQPAIAPAMPAAPAKRDVVEHRTVVHHTYAQAKPVERAPQQVAEQSPAPAPAPVAQNSPLGIGIGAVVGGLIGNQVGGGKGKAIATIAGAVGGGYVGNEIAKKNQQQQ
jgi:uncharacterized protein YcfJ